MLMEVYLFGDHIARSVVEQVGALSTKFYLDSLSCFLDGLLIAHPPAAANATLSVLVELYRLSYAGLCVLASVRCFRFVLMRF